MDFPSILAVCPTIPKEYNGTGILRILLKYTFCRSEAAKGLGSYLVLLLY